MSSARHSTDWEQSFAAAARLLAETDSDQDQSTAFNRDYATERPRFQKPMLDLPEPSLPSRAMQYEQDRVEQARQPSLPVTAPANDLPIKRGEVLNSELRRLAGWVLGMIDGPGLPVLGITGIDPRSGDAAALATDLARAMAAHLPRVMLLDASPSPQQLEICLPPAARSLTDFLAGRASLSEVIARDEESGLHWIAGAKNGAGARLEGILQALTAGYDLVIIHAGAYKMAEPRALLGCQAVAVCAPMIQALEARQVMQGLQQAGIAYTEFAASSGSGNNSSRGVWAA